MVCKSTGHSLIVVSGLILALVFCSFGTAGNPYSAFYGQDSNKLFWFIHASDTHIGASGTKDSDNLSWLVTTARQVIKPSFIMVTGDLTDSTNGNIFGYPNGPYQSEWDQYKSILSSAGITPDSPAGSEYYDIPGNHDAYNDKDFSYYLNNSIQGRETHNTQVSFVKSFSFGKYHFLGINTAGNTGSPFSIFKPYGDYAGLDSTELSFINQQMNLNADAALTLVFGHHPLFATGNSQDTFVSYGLSEFLSYMDLFSGSMYGFGHTHVSSDAFFVPNSGTYKGFYYFNVADLGKSDLNQYNLMAIDCNGISSRTLSVGAWPAVLITAPLDVTPVGSNPYAYLIPPSSSNPIRALVFDPGTVLSVQYQIDQYPPVDMSPVGENVWSGVWNASSLIPGSLHTVKVTAGSDSGISIDSVVVQIEQSAPTLLAGAGITETGKYVKGKFRQSSIFSPGNTVVFKLSVKDSNGTPVAGATASLNITGPSQIQITSKASDAAGIAEAAWTTTAPSKKRTNGTPTGPYSATITGVTAAGYSWDGIPNSIDFTIQ